MMGCSSTKNGSTRYIYLHSTAKSGGWPSLNNLEVIEDPNHFRHGKRDTDTPKQVCPELGTKVPKVSKS